MSNPNGLFVTKCFILILIACSIIELCRARPEPEPDNNGQDLLSGRETRYGYPLFWFGRPLYDDIDEDLTGNGGQNSELARKSASLSLTNIGAGWGR